MPTVQTKKIGSAGGGTRDYTTIQAFEDAVPANMVTADEQWTGECYNDSNSFAGAGVQFDSTGHTTDATRYIHLTAHAGDSFQDNAGVRTNALKYNQSNGVGIEKTDNYNFVMRPGSAYTRVSRLQLKATGSATGIYSASDGTLKIAKDLIIQTATGYGFDIYDAGLAINVSVFITGSTAGSNGASIGQNSKAIGCGVVRSSDVTGIGTGFVTSYNNNIIQSCYSFGFTLPASATGWDTTNSKFNATEVATGLPGSSNQHSVTFSETTPFTNAKASTVNLIPIAATSLINNGFRDATNAPNDITGTARTSTPTIGPFEFVVTSTFPPVPAPISPLLTIVTM